MPPQDNSCALFPASTTQEFFWDDLLEYIEEGRVIPIVGAELLTVSDGQGGEAPLMSVLAAPLAVRLRVPAEECTGDDALHAIVCSYLQRGGRREEIYPRIRTLMKELASAAPKALRASRTGSALHVAFGPQNAGNASGSDRVNTPKKGDAVLGSNRCPFAGGMARRLRTARRRVPRQSRLG